MSAFPDSMETRVTVAEYDLEYTPGRIYPDGTFDDAADPRLKVYKIDRNFTPDADACDPSDPSRPQPCKDYEDWPVADGAPVDSTGAPLFVGDQTLWSVYNDADRSTHTNNAGSSNPQNIEIQQTTFAFNRQGPLGNMIFVKFKLFNRGQETLEDTYVSMWTDIDMGGATDDLAGCDTLLSLGYVYNATNADEIYGSAPPAVGFDFFQGPIVPSPGDTAYVSGVPVPGYRNLPMASFNKYINGTDPDSRSKSYNYMRGLESDGSLLIDPTTNRPTRYYHAGDPVTGIGWVDDSPSDKRIMLSSGPFTMAPGDSQEVVVALIVAQATERLKSVTLLKLYDQRAQDLFDANFELIPPPPDPTLYVREMDNEIDLVWSTDNVGWSDVNPGKWEEYHQGYNVYQGPSIAGPWSWIAGFDVADTLGNIYRDTFDSSGNIVRVLYQTGGNTSLKHEFRVDHDYILGGPLNNDKEYFFALGTYGVDVLGLERFNVSGSLVGHVMRDEDTESIQTVTAIPRGSATIIDQQADHVAGVSDGSVRAAYVDQDLINDHQYSVTFRANPDSATMATIPFVWDLTDKTLNTIVLNGMTVQDEGLEDPIVTNGFVLDVVGPTLTMDSVTWTNGVRWLSAVDAGLSGFNGGVGLASDNEWGWGSTLTPADFSKTVEIRFSDNEADWSDCASYRRDQGYDLNEPVGRFPGSVWDVTVEPARRLNVIFTEDDRLKPSDGKWNPDGSSDGSREYLFVCNSDYDGGANHRATVANLRAQPVDLLMVGWLYLRPGHPFLESNAIWIWKANYINTPDDVFEFQTHPAGTTAGSVVGNDLAQIRVVPNPYLNQSAYELNQFDRIVRFTNLPSSPCTIRIFNLGGELVRTLTKDDPRSAIATWDLQNSSAIPVASGIYIYQVDVKGLGTKTGKMAVFIEKERLNRF